jgi:hypothetical protein
VVVEKQKCPYCDFEGKTGSALAAHVRAKHPEALVVKAAPAPEPAAPVVEEEEYLPQGLQAPEAFPVPEPVQAPVPVAAPVASASADKEPEPQVIPNMYLVTDMASYGPVKINGKDSRIYKGILYPYVLDEQWGRLLAIGAVRVATEKDIRLAKLREDGGPNGTLTSAAMAGVGLKQQ